MTPLLIRGWTHLIWKIIAFRPSFHWSGIATFVHIFQVLAPHCYGGRRGIGNSKHVILLKISFHIHRVLDIAKKCCQHLRFSSVSGYRHLSDGNIMLRTGTVHTSIHKTKSMPYVTIIRVQKIERKNTYLQYRRAPSVTVPWPRASSRFRSARPVSCDSFSISSGRRFGVHALQPWLVLRRSWCMLQSVI
jgi:hypothetical protein